MPAFLRRPVAASCSTLSAAATPLCAAFCLALLFLLSATPVQAQDKDLSELEHYTLTMDKVNRYVHVQVDAVAYGKAHPDAVDGLKSALETDADKHESTDEIARRMSANPAVAGILARNGWTAHEYVVCQFTFIQTSMAAAMKPADKTDAQYAAQVHVNPANLAFMREHQAEIQATMKQAKASTGD